MAADPAAAGPGRVLITPAEIAARVAELGQAIREDYAGRVPLLVGVLKGAIVFAADLMRAVGRPVEVDFIGLASYGTGARSAGVVRLTADLGVSMEGKDVIVIEDIIDTGHTWAFLRKNLLTRHPASLALCALLDKLPRRQVDVRVDYAGFVIPDEFVVGYGLDHGGRYRTLPHICVLDGAA